MACPQRRSFLALLALPILLAGCGGSDGGGTNGGTNSGNGGGTNANRVTSGVVVNWSERTRAVNGGSAPLSARISFTRPGAAADTTFIVDRRDALSAYTETYLTPTPVVPGGTTIQVDFYANKGATGSLVSTARFSAVVRSDGTLATIEGGTVGTVTATSNIDAVTIQAPTSLQVRETAQLNAVARDSAGNIVALTPGSFNFQNAGDGSLITLTSAGALTAVRPGTASVRVSVDGKTSANATIAIQYGSLSGITVIEGRTNDIAYSAARDRLFVATTSDASKPNAVLSYVPSSGALDAVYRLNGRLGVLAPSADGSVLYVSLRDASAFQRIDTANGQVGTPVSLGNGTSNVYAEDLVVSPTNPNVVAVSKANEGISPRFAGLSLYVDGIDTTAGRNLALSNKLGFNADGSELYGLDSEISSFELTAFTVASDGLTQTRQRGGAVSEFNVTIQTAGDRIYASQGSVFDASLTRVGRFDNHSRNDAFAIDAATNRAYFASSQSNGLLIEVFDTTTFALVASRTYSLSGGPNHLAFLGQNQIAVSVDERIYILDLSVG